MTVCFRRVLSVTQEITYYGCLSVAGFFLLLSFSPLTMRVRHLHTYLNERQLLKVSSLDEIKGRRIGIDAVYWLRGLPVYSDPLLGATGESSAALTFAVHDAVLRFHKAGITPVFVFRGIEPPGHRLFTQQQPQHEAWELYYSRDRESFVSLFAGCGNRLTAEDERLALKLLQQMGCETMQAAYVAPAQLSYLLEARYYQAVLGPPSMILFGVSRVITRVDLEAGLFVWLEKEELLSNLGLTGEQFSDSCLLAGTDYCLTFPYLNLAHLQAGGSPSFSFGSAVEFIRQAPISSYLQQFPSEQMKLEHIDGYCIGKCLLSYPLVLKETGDVEVLVCSSVQQPRALPLPPKDFSQVVGLRLPPAVYGQLAEGRLSREIAMALAQGEWIDPVQPAVDSLEFAEVFNEIVEYRRKALGLVAMRLHSKFHRRRVVFVRAVGEPGADSGAQALLPATGKNLERAWDVSAAAVAAELQRQGRQAVDIAFCLEWIANATEQQKNRLFGSEPAAAAAAAGTGKGAADMDSQALLAACILQLLDAVCLFTESGDSTVFGSALAEVPTDLQETVLVSLELLKLGLLTGDPLEAPKGRGYPQGVLLSLMESFRGFAPKDTAGGAVQRAALLLQRVALLLPLQQRPKSWWTGDLCMDLRGFNCVVSALRSALRQLADACLVSRLLKDPHLSKLIPPPTSDGGWLPSFPSTGCCMGLVMRFFLRYEGAPPQSSVSPLVAFETAIRGTYTSAEDPVRDICKAIRLWGVLGRVIRKLSLSVDVSELLQEVQLADMLLERQIEITGLAEHPAFPKP